MIIIAKITDEERIKRYKSLKLTPQEERELLAYDKAIEKGEKGLEYDLSPEKAKIARQFAHIGERKTPMVIPRSRKENPTKARIITAIAEFLENSKLPINNLQIVNKERQISFLIGDESFDITLIKHNKSKK